MEDHTKTLVPFNWGKEPRFFVQDLIIILQTTRANVSSLPGAFHFGGRPNPRPLPPLEGQAAREGKRLPPSPARGGAGEGSAPKLKYAPACPHTQEWSAQLPYQ